MWVRNDSDYPEVEVSELVAIGVTTVDMRRVYVRVKNIRDVRRRGPYRGRAYQGVPSISSAPAAARNLVTLHLGPPRAFPVRPHRPTRRSPVIEISSWREALVFVAAHEAKHIEQFRHRLPVSEVACNLFAAAALDRYRLLAV